MNDPYQILNIPPTATDEEVKRAYRDLARKYHPDNYHDNPLADLAQEKMKEINEAYDQIVSQRKKQKQRPFTQESPESTTFSELKSPESRWSDIWKASK